MPILLSALAYALLGMLGVALAIPPNYASPVFPAAGLAVALVLRYGRRILPAIGLGSLLLNIEIALGNGSFGWVSLAVAVAIGLGATLQAFVAGRLLSGLRGTHWRRLETERDIALFLALAGPLACLINATVGTATLRAGGLIDANQLSFTWWNWWLGDTLGVLVFAPLALMFIDRRQTLWRRRRLTVAAPMLMVLSLLASAFFGMNHWESRQQRARLAEHGQQLAQAIDRRLLANEEALQSLRRLLEVQPDMKPAQFDYFARITLAEHPDILALSFSAYVRQAGRAAFEARLARDSGRPGLRIGERDVAGRPVAALPQPAYVAVAMSAAREGRSTALGDNLLADPLRRSAIEQALRSGRPSATAPFRLTDGQDRPNVLSLQPVYRQRSPDGGGEALPLGFAGALIAVDGLARRAADRLLPAGLEFRLGDRQAPADEGLLFRSAAGSAEHPWTWRTQLTLADRQWALEVYPTEAYIAGQRSLLAWLVGVGGLLFAALLQTVLLATSGRAAQVKRLVDEQTEDLRRAKDAADAANLAKSQFLATMSHEIRTPMNGILGMAQLLHDDSLSASERHDFLRTLTRSGQSLQALLDDILDLSRVESGKLELHPAACEPGDILAEMASLFAGNAQQKKLALTVERPEPGGTRYLIDVIRLRQMLSNLISNAIKFTDRGRIEIAAREIGRGDGWARLEFAVSDTGIGIAPEQQALLFQPFRQVDGSSARRFGGAGLGLSIVRKLAEMMDGTAGVDSQAGQGSRFWFTLRVPLAPTTPAAMPPAVPAARLPRRPGAAASILIVEDNATNRKVAEAILRKKGYTIFSAEHGQAAVDLIAGGLTADLILMDCQMPVLDGYAATRLIRQLELESGQHRHPIVALTAGAFDDDRLRCQEVGMDDFIAKPIDIAELDRVLARWCDRRLDPRPAGRQPTATARENP